MFILRVKQVDGTVMVYSIGTIYKSLSFHKMKAGVFESEFEKHTGKQFKDSPTEKVRLLVISEDTDIVISLCEGEQADILHKDGTVFETLTGLTTAFVEVKQKPVIITEDTKITISEVKKGCLVKHKEFGNGHVTKVHKDYISIYFDGGTGYLDYPSNDRSNHYFKLEDIILHLPLPKPGSRTINNNQPSAGKRSPMPEVDLQIARDRGYVFGTHDHYLATLESFGSFLLSESRVKSLTSAVKNPVLSVVHNEDIAHWSTGVYGAPDYLKYVKEKLNITK